MKIRTVYVSKEEADAIYEKAECILLAVKGKYYYSESFTKFIEIQEWEYDRIMSWALPLLFHNRFEKTL